MLKIDSSCIHCGRCSETCPGNVIRMENGTPTGGTGGCIACGQCEAICPVGALCHEGIPHEEAPKLPEKPLDPATAELFLRSRRSIRCFKPDAVSKEETEKLLNIARYAQTASNSQSVDYLVLADRAKRDALHSLLEQYIAGLDEPRLKEGLARRKNMNVDWLLRGAPMCIFALTPKGDAYTALNPKTTLTYIELFAPTLGLGTCWGGYLQRYAATNAPEFRELLAIPEGKVVTGALLYGYPKYRYHRLTARNPIEVYWR